MSSSEAGRREFTSDRVVVKDGSYLPTMFYSELGGRGVRSPASTSVALSSSAQDQSRRSF